MLPVAIHLNSGSQSRYSAINKNMCRLTIITVSFLMCERVLALSIDQRQTGDLNVQIDLKNFNIFALTKGKEEYVDYDYAYDYSEMTIKPQNGTTSTTIKPMDTTETAVQTDKDNITITEFELTTKLMQFTEATEKVTTVSAIPISTTVPTTTKRDNAPNDTTATAETNNTPTLLECKKGFFRNSKGNCELKLQNPSYTLLKMLQEKSKPNRGHGVRKS